MHPRRLKGLQPVEEMMKNQLQAEKAIEAVLGSDTESSSEDSDSDVSEEEAAPLAENEDGGKKAAVGMEFD